MSIISAAAFRDQLDRWDVDFIEHSRRDRCLNRTVDWSDHEARRGRDCARRGWDAHGIAIHHSGGPTSWEFVWDGRSDVPGPLYTVLIYPDGKAHLTGWRITNNVGRCDTTVRNRVLAGKMPTSGGNVSPGGDDYSAANSEFYGISYRGTEPNAAQRKTALLICAAICSAHGSDWDGGSVAGHKELTRRKPDPAGENMSAFRADLNALLKNGPGGTDMALNKRETYDAVWRTDNIMLGPAKHDVEAPKRYWTPESVLEYVGHALYKRYPKEDGTDNTITPRTGWKWAYIHAREGREVAEKTLALVETIADAQLGSDAAEIKEHVDARHAEAAQQRQVIADTMTAKLDAVVEATQGSDPAEAKLAAILEILGVDA